MGIWRKGAAKRRTLYAALRGVLVALLLLPGLVLGARLAALAGAYFPAVFSLSALLLAAGTLLLAFFSKSGKTQSHCILSTLNAQLPTQNNPTLQIPHFTLFPSVCLPLAAWLFPLLAVSRGLTLGSLYALLLFAAVTAFTLTFLGVTEKIVRAVPEAIFEALPVTVGAMLVLFGTEMGRLLLASPLHLVMLGDFADPLAFFTLVGVLVLLFLRAAGVSSGLALLGSFLLTAAITLLEGFWAMPDAPFYAPEGFDRAAGMFLLAGGDGETAIFAAVAVFPFLVLFFLLAPLAVSGAFGSGKEDQRHALLFASGLNVLAALLGALPLWLAPESAAGFLEQEAKCQARNAPPKSSSDTHCACSRAIGFSVTFALFACAAPLAPALADFPAMFAAPVIGAGWFLLLRSSFSFAGLPLADGTAALALILLAALTYDLGLALGVALLLYVLLKILAGEGQAVAPFLRAFVAVFLLAVILARWNF